MKIALEKMLEVSIKVRKYTKDYNSYSFEYIKSVNHIQSIINKEEKNDITSYDLDNYKSNIQYRSNSELNCFQNILKLEIEDFKSMIYNINHLTELYNY